MRLFRFSVVAAADLLEIGEYTLRMWGEVQTARYLDSIKTRCQRLADNPGLGRSCDSVRPGLRRLEQGKHVIFFRATNDGILVSRVLHEQMLPELHDFADGD